MGDTGKPDAGTSLGEESQAGDANIATYPQPNLSRGASGRTRIRWSRARLLALRDCFEASGGEGPGRTARLDKEWNSRYPDLKCSGAALLTRFRTAQKEGTYDPVPSPKATADPGRGSGGAVKIADRTPSTGQPHRPGTGEGSSRDEQPVWPGVELRAPGIGTHGDGSESGKRDSNTQQDTSGGGVPPEELTGEEREVWKKLLSKAGSTTERFQLGKRGDKLPKERLVRADQLFSEWWKGVSEEQRTVDRLCQGVYAAGLFVTKREGRKSPPQNQRRPGGGGDDIQRLRKQISWIDQEALRERSCRRATNHQRYIRFKLAALWRKLCHGKSKDPGTSDIARLRETLVGRLNVRVVQQRETLERQKARNLSARVRRDGLDAFDREVRDAAIVNAPPLGDHFKFWSDIVGTPAETAANSFRKNWEQAMHTKTEQRGGATLEPLRIDIGEWSRQIRKLKAWTAAGPDGIRNVWWKLLPSAAAALRVSVQSICNGIGKIPEGLCVGRTILVPKTTDVKGPSDYRPIACLNTAYKVMTGIMAGRLMDHLLDHEILPVEQRALRRSRGTLDLLLRDEAILLDAKARGRELNVTWLDFTKAFDKVDHKWVATAAQAIGLPAWWQTTLGKLMERWSTRLEARVGGKTTKTSKLQMLRGLMQGDSLSPVLFAMVICPVSWALNESRGGYFSSDGTRTTHGIFVDDIKLYAQSETERDSLVAVAQSTSQACGMEFGWRKCATARIQGQKVGRALTVHTQLPAYGPRETYKYVGFEQTGTVDSRAVFQRVKTEYVARVRKLCAHRVTVSQFRTIYNTACVGYLRYYAQMGVISKTQAKDLEVQARKEMERVYIWSRNQATCRLYLKVAKGGLGLKSLEAMVRATASSVSRYLLRSEDQHVKQTLHVYEGIRALARYQNCLVRGFAWNNVTRGDGVQGLPTDKVIESEILEGYHRDLLGRPVHGRFWKREVGSRDNEWLRVGTLSMESASIIMQAQDGVTRTHEYCARTYRSGESVLCRMCKTGTETLDHLLVGCPVHEFGLYKDKHDSVCQVLWDTACTEILGLAPAECRRDVITVQGRGKLLWDVSIATDETFSERRPDLVMIDEIRRRVYVVEVAVAYDPRVLDRAHEKLGKYHRLSRELARQYLGYEVLVVPVVPGNLGSMVAVEKFLPTLHFANDHLARRVQTAALLGTVRLIRSHFAYPDH
jgi:hypothetical protein